MKKIYYLLLFVLFSSFTYGALNDTVIHRFPLIVNEDDVITGLDYTNHGVTFSQEGGLFEQGNGDYTDKNVFILQNMTLFTLCGIFNVSSLSATRVLYSEADGVNNGLAIRIRDEAGSYKLNWYPTDTAVVSSTTTILTDTEYSFCARYNDTTGLKELFLNGVEEDSGNDDITMSAGISTFGDWSHIYQQFDGFLREFCFFNSVLSEEDIITYNNTQLCNATTSEEPPAECTITLNTNLTNGTINYNNPNLNFNYSATFSNCNKDIANVTFFLNGDSNETLLDVNLSNQNYFNITFPYNYENWFNISVNASNYEAEDSTILYFYNVDLVFEMINTTCLNDTIETQGNTYSCYVNYTDLNLFATNTSILDGNGNLWESENYFYENLTESSITKMKVNLSFSLTDLGNFSLVMNSWDSHTDIELENYKIDYLSNGLEFEDSIKIYSNDVIKTDTNKFYDRYDFSFTYDKNATVWKSIFIETTGSLYYVQNSIYKYHLVDFKNKKWIDFEGFEMPLAEIIKHSSNKYEIKFRSEETEIKFNSIGDLNEDILIFKFEVISPESEVNLTGIENALNNIYNVFEGGFTMMMLIIFCGLFLVLGVIVKFYYMWFFSALGFAIIGVDYIMRIVNEGEDFTLNFLIAITFVVLSFILVLLAYILQARLNNLQNKDKYDLYDIY